LGGGDATLSEEKRGLEVSQGGHKEGKRNSEKGMEGIVGGDLSIGRAVKKRWVRGKVTCPKGGTDNVLKLKELRERRELGRMRDRRVNRDQEGKAELAGVGRGTLEERAINREKDLAWDHLWKGFRKKVARSEKEKLSRIGEIKGEVRKGRGTALSGRWLSHKGTTHSRKDRKEGPKLRVDTDVPTGRELG